MSLSPLLKYSLPALVLGALGGFFVGDTLEQGSSAASKGKTRSNLREKFLSDEADEFDYEKIARVCLAASGRAAPRTTARASIMAEPGSPKVTEAKEHLDSIMSQSLKTGTWSRGAGVITETLLQRLPPSDVAEFETLLQTTIERGDMVVQPGAWLPRNLN